MPRILLVEDNPGVRALIVDLLTDEGLVVSAVAGGEEALRLVDVEPVGLLVTDINMPRMNGHDLAQSLRERMPELPVLFISAFPNTVVAEAGEPLLGTRFLSKPFDPDVLCGIVHELLSSSITPGLPAV